MNNDTLIEQARQLYAVLQVEQFTHSVNNKSRFGRLDELVKQAYCRYLRRLNRCVWCYHDRLQDCTREIWCKMRKPCPRRSQTQASKNQMPNY